MNVKSLTDDELKMLHNSLDSVIYSDAKDAALHRKLTRQLKTELANRGYYPKAG